MFCTVTVNGTPGTYVEPDNANDQPAGLVNTLDPSLPAMTEVFAEHTGEPVENADTVVFIIAVQTAASNVAARTGRDIHATQATVVGRMCIIHPLCAARHVCVRRWQSVAAPVDKTEVFAMVSTGARLAHSTLMCHRTTRLSYSRT